MKTRNNKLKVKKPKKTTLDNKNDKGIDKIPINSKKFT